MRYSSFRTTKNRKNKAMRVQISIINGRKDKGRLIFTRSRDLARPSYPSQDEEESQTVKGVLGPSLESPTPAFHDSAKAEDPA